MQNSEMITQEILGLERKYWTAMRDHDLDSAMSLTDFPCLVAGAHGVYSVDKENFEKMFSEGGNTVKSFNFDEKNVQVRLAGPNTAIIAYKVHTTFLKDGKDQTIDAVDTSTWIKRDNHWVCSMHTETELQPQ